MTIKIKLSQIQIAKIRKGDIINLELTGSEKKPTELKVIVEEIVSDVQKCAGCGCRLDNKQVYEFRRKQFCFDCYKRRIDEHRELAQISATKRAKQTAYWRL